MASAVIAPPPASSRRCGATLASARASSSAVNGALRLNWLPLSEQAGLRARQPVLDAGQLPPPQPRNRERGQPAMRAVQAAQSGQGVQSGDVPGHEHRPGARAGRREPEGDRRAQRRRADDLDTDADRGQGRRDLGGGPPPTSSIGQRSGRQGPSRPGKGPGSHRPSWAIAAGRTTTPSSRTGFISSTSVGDPRPSPRSRACAWSVTPGLTGPCQVTRTWLSSGDTPPSTTRALWSPAIWDCAATPATNAAASAMPSAGSNHRAGRRRPRAAASISGASQPRTLGQGADSAGWGAARLWRASGARPDPHSG